MIKVLYLQIN